MCLWGLWVLFIRVCECSLWGLVERLWFISLIVDFGWHYLWKYALGCLSTFNFMSSVGYCRFLVCVNRLPLTPNSNKFFYCKFFCHNNFIWFYFVAQCAWKMINMKNQVEPNTRSENLILVAPWMSSIKVKWPLIKCRHISTWAPELSFDMTG